MNAYFNSRPSARGDDQALQNQITAHEFQFTPLREGRRILFVNIFFAYIFQFTPLREGRLLLLLHWKKSARISIHAPPRGATRRFVRMAPTRGISIHAPPRGATRVRTFVLLSGNISIHAPPRGATKLRGATFWHTKFQFTPLREGRRLYSAVSVAARYFNSRPSARGDDVKQGNVLGIICISIHAPPRGATFPAVRPLYTNFISIHAPPRGATFYRHALPALVQFQFTPLREGRLLLLWKPYPFREFQFTPLREGRPLLSPYTHTRYYFNSRPSARGDIKKSHALFILKHFNSRPSARGDSKRYAISANLLFNPYKSAWLNNNATQFVEIILVIFHRIIA